MAARTNIWAGTASPQAAQVRFPRLLVGNGIAVDQKDVVRHQLARLPLRRIS